MTTENSQTTPNAGATESVKLNGLYAFKVGMAQVYDDKGVVHPVTVLRYDPWVVTQVKTRESDGYEALQIACRPQKENRTTKAQQGALQKAGMKGGAQFVRELRQTLPQGAAVGSKIEITSLAKGDVVRATARSKGKGFQGSVKRWNFGGGPGAHGSCFHRQPGSSGNRTWPGRIMKGKRFPGHLGDESVTVKNLKIIDVMPEDNVILVAGPVPGARNSLVRLLKV